MPKRRASAIYVPDSDEEQQQIQAARGEAEPLPAMTSPRAAKRGRASPAKAKKPPQEKRLSRWVAVTLVQESPGAAATQSWRRIAPSNLHACPTRAAAGTGPRPPCRP